MIDVKLAILMVLTPDLIEAQAFYEGVLGFSVHKASEDLLVLDHQGVALHVYRCEAPAPVLRHGRDAATTAVFAVASIEDAMTVLTQKGVKFLHNAPASNAFGRYAAFKAPGGNIHEIFEPHA